MPSLVQDLALVGITIETIKKEEKDGFVQMDFRDDVKANAFVNRYVEKEVEIKKLGKQVGEMDVEILDLSMTHVVDEEAFKSLQLIGTQGSIKVIPQDRYNPKDLDACKAELKSRGLDPKDYFTTEKVTELNYSEMTRAEHKALAAFIQKTFAADRAAELVSEVEETEISGLHEVLPTVAKDVEDLNRLRKICGHYQPQVKVDTKKAPLAKGVVTAAKKRS